ncbi:polysialyltransferase family glycosyltransferase [Spiroplasma endosymbiont of Panorpa germanica]|uniref:polysialyltransferase family glycosyltransferase n=1 Tax=Spiroplasma endosymbiont of Panorpa germanica TaxID=3066314 RepID=UPI0030CAF888
MKKLLTILASISLVSSTSLGVVSCQLNLKLVDIDSRYNFTPNEIKDDEHEGINNYLQTVKKQNELGLNTGTLYYVSRAGAAIGVQAFVSAISEALMFPERQIVIYLSNDMNPDGPLGKNTTNIDALSKNFSNIHVEYLKGSNQELKPFIIQEGIKVLNKKDPNIKKVNLFTDDYSMSSKVSSKSLTNLSSVMNQVEILTLMTDGTAHNTFSLNLYDDLKYLSSKNFEKLSSEVVSLFSGDFDKKTNMKKYINTFFPLVTSRNSYGVRYINSWAINDVQFYDESNYWRERNTYSSVGAGINDAIMQWKNEDYEKDGLQIFKDVFQLTDDKMPKAESELNFVYSGNKMGEGITVKKSAEAVKSIDNYLKEKHSSNDYTIWFKPHPRESDKNIKDFIKAAENVGVNNIKIMKQEIPLEIYLYAGAFNKVDDKEFRIIPTATSTVVMALYDSKIDNITETYLFDSEEQLNTYKNQYGVNSLLYNGFKNVLFI